ncbi:MAG TPA: hypothetical protein VGH02_03880 [Rhizomicrobium sp.]|jgi:hypothetical protein
MRSPLDVLYNFHWVRRGEMARSAQAYAGMLGHFLRRHRIRAVINLRGPNPKFFWWRYESKVCRRLGIAHYDVSVNSRTLPARELLIEILNTFDGASKPALIKCSGGQDRTSLAAALYIVHRDGWTALPDALDQFAKWPYLHFPKQHQRWLRLFLPYAAKEAAGVPLSRWIAEAYSPERFMAWLDSEGWSDTFRNLPGQPPRALS